MTPGATGRRAGFGWVVAYVALGWVAIVAIVLVLAPELAFTAGLLVGFGVGRLAVRSDRAMAAGGEDSEWWRLSVPARRSLEEQLRRDYAEDVITAVEFELRLSRLVDKIAELDGERFDPFGPLLLKGRWEFRYGGRLVRLKERTDRARRTRPARRAPGARVARSDSPQPRLRVGARGSLAEPAAVSTSQPRG